MSYILLFSSTHAKTRIKTRRKKITSSQVNIVLEIDSPLDREPCDAQDFSAHDAQCHFLFDSHSRRHS
ncbi:uncharacterized protein LACBIDRAFT_310597 [Laccaria bicolor S238N-H82]|uniref:Predicted protein n=1 Tax=Laccaria bicolor (strain S238N-H82 / ATCC MYA-4686) TaxID=486041 RepID=B0DUN8_LACBS|nr:uncharacterized protein LACBIDRAFT_310597 [Laccaria bicolor S238N-H82]EDR01573.1 predicted protein [Laccaria bicolor S238N-H82]|eukprot:XP_001887649.1 predicted protein [Laccaria bicolor S238N-H82]